MPNGDPERLRHLQLEGTAAAEPYTHPGGGGGAEPRLPVRDRSQHSQQLLDELRQAEEDLERLQGRREAAGVPVQSGMYLDFASEPEFQLTLESLDRRGEGIELVSVREEANRTHATVYVPHGKLGNLERLVTRYRDEVTATEKPKHMQLVESIAQIRRAALRSFWTDDPELLPQEGVALWWEIWLRVAEDRERVWGTFVQFAGAVGLQLGTGRLDFQDRTVVLAYGTREMVQESADLLDCIAELRSAKESPEFFVRLQPAEQAEWIEDLLQRIELPRDDAPGVCVLDTGVNRGHPLLVQSLPADSTLTCDPGWGVADHKGHGTEIAGLSLFGDLSEAFMGAGIVRLEHGLESVKILPPPGEPPNSRELFGYRTSEAVGRAELQNPHRHRVFCLAVSAPDGRDRGRPSSWSAALDAVAFGGEQEPRRLLVVSAGNVRPEHQGDYPDRNEIDSVHDPAQAWNALTVGAFTQKWGFSERDFPGWRLLGSVGGLCPSSTTGIAWERQWPNKPDVVLEGGNSLLKPGSGEVATDHSLQLLTTDRAIPHRLLTTSGDTSAATAQAARMAAILAARYPDLWPETIRALLVHSAEWTPTMLEGTERLTPSDRAHRLLRLYGYGVPDLGRASWSAANSLTLIAQEEGLFPYKEGSGGVRNRDLHLHSLPWPREQLLELGPTPATLRVTLSYFIEPNPANRAWIHKFRYQSHGLRFSIKAPTESLADFRARISEDLRDEDHDGAAPNDPGWVIGPQVRNRGSLHADIWEGSAAALAERGYLAVFPVGGWWKERKHLEKWRQSVRYSLVVSIETPAEEVDIYTAVRNQIAVPVPVEA